MSDTTWGVIVLIALALLIGSLADDDKSSTSSKPSAPPISAVGPGGTDSDSGFPLDENGEVSSDPEDYRESVCKSVANDLYYADDYDAECTAYGYGP